MTYHVKNAMCLVLIVKMRYITSESALLVIVDSVFSANNDVWFIVFVNGNKSYFFRLGL